MRARLLRGSNKLGRIHADRRYIPRPSPRPPRRTIRGRNAGWNETTVHVKPTTRSSSRGELLRRDGAVRRRRGRTTSGQVVDVTIVPVQGAMITTSTCPPPRPFRRQTSTWGRPVSAARSTHCRAPRRVGPTRRTAGSGTGASTRFEGVIPTLSGLSAEAGIYPTRRRVAGRLLQQRCRHAPVLQRDLHGPEGPVAVDIEQPGLVPGRPGGDHLLRYRHREPDQRRHHQAPAPTTSCYPAGRRRGRHRGRCGLRSSRTRSPEVAAQDGRPPLVHAGQRDAALFYQLPQTWTNVANAWEVSTVQDYVSIRVMRMGSNTNRRYSIFSAYEALYSSPLVLRAFLRATVQRHHPLLLTLRREWIARSARAPAGAGPPPGAVG